MTNKKSIDRAAQLKNKAAPYLHFKKEQLNNIKKRHSKYLTTREKFLSFFNATLEDWYDWKWQLNFRVTDATTLQNFVYLTDREIADIEKVSKINRFSSTPYYLSLICEKDDPIKTLSVPSICEIETFEGEIDPMDEEHTNPSGSVTRRYPDRLIINVTNQCAMFCRHCQRRRLINDTDVHTSDKLIKQSIDYVRKNKEIRDVLLTGGDALLLPDTKLEHILQQLRAIEHVEIIRIGSRTPVSMPMRITDELCQMIQKYHPIYLNTHFNHFYEITEDSKEACKKLTMHGINIGNQAVLLKGINDNPFTMTLLSQMLLSSHIRPYYIFHAKNVEGTTHLIPKLSDGLKIMEYMRGNTSGMAIPTYIMNAPMGLGKVPLLPEYILKAEDNEYTIRTWENKTFTYREKL